MSVDICTTSVDSYPLREVVDRIVHSVERGEQGQYVVTPNAQHIVTLYRDAYFRKIYRGAMLRVPDGVPLLWAAKLLGTPLNGRVNGTDLFESLCAVSAKRGLRVFLLGGRPGAADAASRKLQERHPTLNIVGTYCPPYGFEADARECQRINEQVKLAAPDILFVGLGAPKQERWIYENRETIDVPVSLGIGVSFELVSGMVTRAPKLMQRLGLEWLFRLLVEPRRLWKRYLLGNVQFVWLVLRQKFSTL